MELSKKTPNASQHPGNLPGGNGTHYSAELLEKARADIFRASGLSLLGVSDSHVEKDQERIQSGRKLSPLLLIRDSVNGKVVIADGYHRLCAAYSCDEDAVIPCKIA
jgi:hypothetical protein